MKPEFTPISWQNGNDGIEIIFPNVSANLGFTENSEEPV
jgi:hypothetical protein